MWYATWQCRAHWQHCTISPEVPTVTARDSIETAVEQLSQQAGQRAVATALPTGSGGARRRRAAALRGGGELRRGGAAGPARSAPGAVVPEPAPPPLRPHPARDLRMVEPFDPGRGGGDRDACAVGGRRLRVSPVPPAAGQVHQNVRVRVTNIPWPAEVYQNI